MKTWLSTLALALLAGVAPQTMPAHPVETVTVTATPQQTKLLYGPARDLVFKVDLAATQRPRKKDRLPINLALVIDRSGSMSGAKIEKARQAAAMVVDALNADDRLAILAFDNEVTTLIPAQPIEDKEQLKRKIDAIRPGGSTAIFAGVEQGASEVLKNKSDKLINRVMLLSDGLANVGPSSTDDLRRLGRKLAEKGIAVTTIGVGDDYNEDLMEALAMASDANYYYVKDTEKLPQVFAKELGEMFNVTARSVRIEITLPDGVKGIEIIGRPEKFVGNRAIVDFGPLSSGQSRYLYVQARLDANTGTAQRDVAVVRTTYHDVADNSAARESTTVVKVNYTDKEPDVIASTDKDVQVGVELQRNAVAKDQAVQFADDAKPEQAAATLRSQATRMRELAASAPASSAAPLRAEAEALDKNAGEVEERGSMSAGGRKAMKADSYQQKNAK